MKKILMVDVERARAAGCSEDLTRPLDEALLFEKLHAHWGL